MPRRREILAAVALLALTAPLGAQQYPSQARGLGASTAYQLGDLDHVNLFNGQLAVTLSLGQSYPVGPGLGYGLALVYNSNLWEYTEQSCALPGGFENYFLPEIEPNSNAGAGWSVHLGKLTAPESPQTRWRYTGPDGSERGLYEEMHPGFPAPGAQPEVRFSSDGSYLRLRRSTTECQAVSGTAAACRLLEFPSGEIHEFRDFGTAQDPDWRLTRMRDRFGNFVDITYTGLTWRLQDSHGRTQIIRFAAPANAYAKVNSVELKSFGGGTATYAFEYRSETLERQGFLGTPCHPATVQADVLERLVLPDGTFYAFGYHFGDGPGQVLSGGLFKMRIPTGGALGYSYQLVPFPSQNPQQLGPDPVGRAFGVLERSIFEDDDDTTPIGTWHYDLHTVGVDLPKVPGDGSIPCHHRTTVTDPEGNDAVHYFSTSHVLHAWSYGLPFTRCDPSYSPTPPFLSQEIFEGSRTSGTKVRSVYVEYESDGRDGGEHQEKNHRLSYRKVVFHDDGDRFREVRFTDFDGLGHYRTATTGGSFDTGNVRSSRTEFNPSRGTLTVIDPETSQLGGNFQIPSASSPWVHGTFTESRVTENGQTAIEEFCFDTGTGFLERHRVLAGSSRSNVDLLQVMTPAATGHVFQERFYGGDLQGPMDNVYGDLCLMTIGSLDVQFQLEHSWRYGALETTEWIDPCDGSQELLAVDNSIDLSTGFPSVSRDPAGVATTWAFDIMGRLIGERPGGGAWLETRYTLPTTSAPNATPQVVDAACPNGTTNCSSGQLLAWSRMDFDGLGRPFEEAQRIPGAGGALDLRERRFTFNAMGWPLTETVWGDFTKSMSWSAHDRFGRPGQVQLPSEPPTRLTYQGERVVTREVSIATGASGQESAAFTTEILDGQGRLERVCENQATAWNGSCSGATTRYEYGVTGALSRVCQNANGSSCGQDRRFTVDRRGFLTAERHPEIGPTGNGWSNYTHDALGNVLMRTIAGSSDFSLGFYYDAAGRLIRLEELNGPSGSRPLKEFAYAHTNLGAQRRAGKLYQTKRHNWVDPVGPLLATGSLDLVVTHSYLYEGLDGRVSRRLTSLKVPEITTYAFDTRFAWHPLGLLEDLTYPQCLHGQCNGRDPPRTVSYDYSRGFLTAIPGYASLLSYQAGGSLQQIQRSNGVVDTFEIDPSNGLDRPYRISTNRGWSTGTMDYDGAGYLKRAGSQSYRFDRLGRMVSGEVAVGGIDRTQSAAYDAYGNLLSLTTNGSTLTTSVNASTNRLTSFSATYDAGGNLTRQIRSGQTHRYTWDPLGMMKYLQSSSDQAQVFLYDADDERLATYDCFPGICASPGWELRTTLRGLGGQVLREYRSGPGGWRWQRDYVYRGGQLLAAEEADGQGGSDTFHFHLDHLGTPRQITNGSGVQVALHSYYPFGQEATNPSQTPFGKRFTGHERDDNGTGTVGDLDYMHSRFCSPTLGRFLSFDPIGGNPRNPQSWNRYAYALNNPLNFTDPFGLQPAGTLYDETFVYDKPRRGGIQLPAWFFDNWFIDATSHLDRSRFDFSQRTYPAWQGWDSRGCDEWCQVFAEVGQAAQAASFIEFGVTSVVMAAITGPLFGKAPRGAQKSAIGFVGGEGASALTPNRLQHGTRHLVEAGVLTPWRGSTSPQLIRTALSPVLEQPLATFDHVLRGGIPVKGFLGQVNGQKVVLFIYKQGSYQGQLATSIAPSASQLANWGVP